MRNLFALALVLAVASPAAADIAPPRPEDLTCRRGAVAEGNPAGAWCAPSTCASDSDCTGGRVCSSDEISLCVEDYVVATERRSVVDEPAPTTTVRRIRQRGCEPDGTCLNLHADCETSRRCVAPDSAAPDEPTEAPSADEEAPPEERGEEEASEARAEEAEANHADSSSGCSCRAESSSGAPLAGLGLMALGLVVWRVRRRG